jgi:hypothetical protein
MGLWWKIVLPLLMKKLWRIGWILISLMKSVATPPSVLLGYLLRKCLLLCLLLRRYFPLH